MKPPSVPSQPLAHWALADTVPLPRWFGSLAAPSVENRVTVVENRGIMLHFVENDALQCEQSTC